ncbi:MAG: hypothetical protein M0Z43_04500 [Acidithiobacillus sp.]|nr:hypothetical protein [Acidithiobacillus sp.]
MPYYRCGNCGKNSYSADPHSLAPCPYCGLVKKVAGRPLRQHFPPPGVALTGDAWGALSLEPGRRTEEIWRRHNQIEREVKGWLAAGLAATLICALIYLTGLWRFVAPVVCNFAVDCLLIGALGILAIYRPWQER